MYILYNDVTDELIYLLNNDIYLFSLECHGNPLTAEELPNYHVLDCTIPVDLDEFREITPSQVLELQDQ
jgi:hypothetical protein